MSYLFAILICAVNFESYTVFFVSNMIFYPYDLLFMGWQAAPKIIPLTRKVQLLTRKVGVKFYGFIFLLKRIFLGNFSTKNVLPIRRKHYRLAALLHDVFRKPHRQKVSLKPKQKTRTSRFLSTLRFLFGSSSWTRTNDPAVNSRMLYQLSYRGIYLI